MASCNTENSEIRYVRPLWPYRDWETSVVSESESHDVMATECSENDAEIDVPDEMDHVVDSDDDIDDVTPIKTLFDLTNSEDVSSTDEAKMINSMITTMIDKTIEKLSSTFKVFKNSYKMAIGSVTERSKIIKPDEFDFAILLPALVDEDVYALLLRQDSIQNNASILELLDDMVSDSSHEFILNFSKCLRMVWANEMGKHLPDGVDVLNTNCYLDDVSVAGTFHIKGLTDNDIIDLDICFWIPLSADKLSSAPDDISQRHHLSHHCLDQQGLVYAILPRDENIDYAINAVRFPMSCLEKETFLQHGEDNNRLKCYRICKCIVHYLVPKYRKRENCDICHESIISSFALKNVVLYLINAYKSDDMWTGGQLANRVIEVFSILCMCQKMNCSVSAYFSPYEIHFNSDRHFSPQSCSFDDRPCEFYGQDKKPCTLPNIDEIMAKFDDPIAKKSLKEFNTFIRQSSWRGPELICRLYEVLCVMRTNDSEEREQMVTEVGWSLFGLHLWDTSVADPNIVSVDTRL